MVTPAGPLTSLVFGALGGTVELFAFEPLEPLEETAEWIRALHRRFTRFEPDSELSQFNARTRQWVEISPELESLLRAAIYAFEESGGLVNVAVLRHLLDAGYDETFVKVAARQVSPPELRAFPHQNSANSHRNGADLHQDGADQHRNGAKTRAAMRARTGDAEPTNPLPDLLKVVPGRALLCARSAIDLGGIAKGWIADRAVERLGPNSLVSCGGDLMARGAGPTGDGWPVGFGDRTLLLKDMAAATSGTTKRRWGNGLHHLIDPRTGAPSTGDLSEVSVLANTALDAEIYAKTALLLGSAQAEDYLRSRSQGWALS